MRELILKKCLKCGALVKVIEDCHCEECGIKCCGAAMINVNPNSVDAAFEKHVPTYELNDDKINVSVNHVMEEDHLIEWICFVTEKSENFVYFNSGDSPLAVFENEKGILYAYCNKHSLWKTEVK